MQTSLGPVGDKMNDPCKLHPNWSGDIRVTASQRYKFQSLTFNNNSAPTRSVSAVHYKVQITVPKCIIPPVLVKFGAVIQLADHQLTATFSDKSL